MRRSDLGVARQRGIVAFRDAVIVGEYIAAPMVEEPCRSGPLLHTRGRGGSIIRTGFFAGSVKSQAIKE
jgi:hypothetical protein